MPDPEVEPQAGSVSVEVKQDGNPSATATAVVTPPNPPPLSPGWTVLSKFLDPSALASIGATAVGLWMLVYQADREATAWFLIGAGGLLVPAIGIAKKVASNMGNTK